MHCPLETPSPWQGSEGGASGSSWVLAIQKPRKPLYEGKIGGKFTCYFVMNSQPILQEIYVGDSTPLVLEVQLLEAH